MFSLPPNLGGITTSLQRFDFSTFESFWTVLSFDELLFLEPYSSKVYDFSNFLQIWSILIVKEFWVKYFKVLKCFNRFNPLIKLSSFTICFYLRFFYRTLKTLTEIFLWEVVFQIYSLEAYKQSFWKKIRFFLTFSLK